MHEGKELPYFLRRVSLLVQKSIGCQTTWKEMEENTRKVLQQMVLCTVLVIGALNRIRQPHRDALSP